VRQTGGTYGTMEELVYPLEVALEPKSKTDAEAMNVALQRLVQDDPCWVFQSIRNPARQFSRAWVNSNSTPRSNSSPDLWNRCKCGRPAGRLSRDALAAGDDRLHPQKQTGAAGQFARVKVEFAPLPPGSGYVFENDVVGGSIPKEFIPSVDKASNRRRRAVYLPAFR